MTSNQFNPKEALFFASCPRGTEELLKEEATELGLSPIVKTGGVGFKTDVKKAIKFIFHSRLASRVFMEVGYFFIKKEDDIYHEAKKIGWSDYMTTNDTFKINTLFDRDTKKRFHNSIYLSQKLKDALVDHQRDHFGKRSNVETTKPTHSFLQRIETKGKSSKVMVYLDLCGMPLDKRGYRDSSVHQAPLRENLAAAILKSADYTKKDKFFDPMSGSGTLLVEAVMIAADIAPSFIQLKNVKKPYNFTRHKWFRDLDLMDWYMKEVEKIVANSRSKIEKLKEGKFFCNDIENDNIKLIKKHLRKCFGRVDFVTFFNEDFLKMAAYPKANFIVMNPPYGKRLGQSENIKSLYHNIGETLKNQCQNSRAFIFTIKDDLHKEIRLKTSRKTPFFNGDLECRLFEYQIES